MAKKDAIFIFILIVILFGLYWKTFGYDLIWDDEVFFKHNLLFIENRPLSSAFKFGYFSEQLGINNQDHYYRPLLTLSYLIENKLWGIKNITLRLTNLLIFILSLTFLYSFLKKQDEKGYFAEIAVLLFALYPLNIDNIVWIVGRGDLLLLLWAALAFLCLEVNIKKGKVIFLIGSSFFYLLGMLSKETFLLFFPILILYELIKRKKITGPYHLANLGLTFLFFLLKNVILNIKNFGIAYNPLSFQGIKAALGTLGFYFRTIIYPFSHDMFLSISRITSLFYISCGLLALILIVFLWIKAKKDRELALPSAIFVIFLAGHVPLIFTNIYPYQIYSRYMMIAALGIIWIIARLLTRIGEKTRFTIVFVILLAFIPSLVLNANSYKNKPAFWQKALKFSPRDPYVLFQAAKTSYDNKDYLSAELALNASLSLSMKRETAIMISQLYADIELARADYDKVFRWLNSIEEFEKDPNIKIAPFIRYQINSKKAKAYMSRGEASAAEKLLEENIASFSAVKEAYSELYGLYAGTEQWEKAAQLEKRMKEILPNYYASLDTKKTEQDFSLYPFEKKLDFYIQNRNYSAAINLIKALSNPDLDQKFLLSKLYYYQGNAEEGEKIIGAILEKDPDSWETLNKVGYFYLGNLIRVQKALPYFEKSLSLNSSQPEIIYVSNRLKNDYLAKLKPVWK
jgi:tetratricopeptide (TPR) repeat protein